ncbi:hypothetical protein NGM37_24755, partial [Streptomyces sp. TRM76130]|nr:hypothetical protein [Streptomyces sp. TRM76130]
MAVEESMSAAELECDGPVRLHNARVQDALVLRGATIGGIEGCLRMPEITIGGGLYLGRGFSCTGTVDLYGASIGGSVELDEATLSGPGAGPGEHALHLGCAQIGGDVRAAGHLVVNGSVTLSDTSIRGSVVLQGSRISFP